LFMLVARTGIEPVTRGFSIQGNLFFKVELYNKFSDLCANMSRLSSNEALQ
jgi:hypothetical protein